MNSFDAELLDNEVSAALCSAAIGSYRRDQGNARKG